MGLDRRKPIDLLQSTEETEKVKTLLTRMDYGVYEVRFVIQVDVGLWF